jgi:HPt (histidine-containing phosphotransfer) domain-containing protein
MQHDSSLSVEEAMTLLWVRFLPHLNERVRLLEQASIALLHESFAPADCAEGGAAAHKLAGVLGSFGLHEGTHLAREAEALCLGAPRPDPIASARVAEIASQLRALLAQRG